MIDFTPLALTFRLAFITTLILFMIGVPLAYWVYYSKFRFKPILEALISMPLVLPPTVIGFYLLLALSPHNWLGAFLKDTFNLRLVFSFEGLVVASIIYSLPFMINPLMAGFAGLPAHIKEASLLMGRSRLRTVLMVLLPNMKPAVLSAIVLTFAHTIGEFGVVLMIGGSIPGETRVASIAIYDKVESLDYAGANYYSIILFVMSFIVLSIVYLYNGGLFSKNKL